MTIVEFFDDVEVGVSDIETFVGKMTGAVSGLLGTNSLSASVASGLGLLQKDVAQATITTNGAAAPMVMTEPVYNQVMAWLGEAVKLATGDPRNAGLTGGSMIDKVVEQIAAAVIPIALDVVPGGTVVKLGLETLAALAPMLL